MVGDVRLSLSTAWPAPTGIAAVASGRRWKKTFFFFDYFHEELRWAGPACGGVGLVLGCTSWDATVLNCW
jgi:hypothetical protein